MIRCKHCYYPTCLDLKRIINPVWDVRKVTSTHEMEEERGSPEESWWRGVGRGELWVNLKWLWCVTQTDSHGDCLIDNLHSIVLVCLVVIEIFWCGREKLLNSGWCSFWWPSAAKMLFSLDFQVDFLKAVFLVIRQSFVLRTKVLCRHEICLI